MNEQSALEQAIDDHVNGRIDLAGQAYREILECDPTHPKALHYYGIYLHQIGLHDEAVEKLQLASSLEPNDAEWLNDMGNVLFALAKYALAENAYSGALVFAETDFVIWNNLGATQLQQEKTEEAISSFLRAIELEPEFSPALQHLGTIYEKIGDKMKASHYQCRSYVLPPLEGKSKEMLGVSFYFLGRLDKAAETYRAWLNEDPANPIAEHMLAACSQRDVPIRASDGYIERHFDRYANTFDHNLVDSLHYRGPEMIRIGLNHIGAPTRQYSIVDIGCGTGMCGPVLSPYSNRLVGVDLAGKMLEKASTTGCYNLLVKAEIGTYLATSPHQCDVVVAADTMIYFGDLQPIFNLVAEALHQGGYYVFTVEVLDPLQVGTLGYQLHASGRYRHGCNYVIRRLAQANMQLLHHSYHALRQEIGEEVTGILFVAQKI
jgi:predicted TPR repeat methyltransferase